METLASKLGISLFSLEQLIKGKITGEVANRLGIAQSILQDFVDGRALQIDFYFGAAVNESKELRDLIGEQGAIGLIVGLLIKN